MFLLHEKGGNKWKQQDTGTLYTMVKPCKQVWKAACVSCQEGILSAGAPQRRCSKPSDLPCKVSGKWKIRAVYTFEIGTYTSLQLFT